MAPSLGPDGRQLSLTTWSRRGVPTPPKAQFPLVFAFVLATVHWREVH